MTFAYRLRLFVFGILLGVPVAWYMMRDKHVMKMPSEIIHEQLASHALQYTKHATCRMECRNITNDEVIDILKNGDINYSKSEVSAEPCKKYAVEGKTKDGQEVRIIFGLCADVTKVITVIDLGVEHTCDCK